MQIAGATIDPNIDGRSQCRVRSRDRIMVACRSYMVEGNFRPLMIDICKRAGVCTRTGFQGFHDIEALHLAAIDDEVTQKAIRVLVYGDRWTLESREVKDRIVLAVVRGRI